MRVDVDLVDFDGWRDEDVRAMVCMARSLGTTDELETMIDGWFEGGVPKLDEVEEALIALDKDEFLSAIKAPEGLDFFRYEYNMYWFRDVPFGKAGTRRIADDRFRALDRSYDPVWCAFDDEAYAYVPLAALAKGDESVIAVMVWSGIDMPEEP